ncbi:hypothetical protein ACX80W_13140 [Arthrobacter sp. TMN-37]
MSPLSTGTAVPPVRIVRDTWARAGPASPQREREEVLFHAGEFFSAVELQAMNLDGLVRRVYRETYRRSDCPEDAVLRARAAANALPAPLRGRVALARQCAAWVYGCAPPPPLLSVVTDHRRRTTAVPAFGATTMHQVALGPFDVNLVGGVPVTTPLRTALDTAVHGPDATAVDILAALASAQGLECPLRLVEAALASTRRVPGKARALARLRQARAGPGGPVARPRRA